MKDDPTSYEDEADMADRNEITKITVDGNTAFLNLDENTAVSVASLKTTGEITQGDKTLDQTYAALGEETAEGGSQPSLAVSPATFTPIAHKHETSETAHTHTYSKVTGVSVTSSGTSDTGHAKISCNLDTSGQVTLTEHSHTYDKTTRATFSGTQVTSDNAKTGITAALDANPKFTSTAHNHGVTDNGHSHTFTASGDNTITTTSTDTGSATPNISATFTNTPYVTACGTHSHTPTYTAPTFSATVTNGVMSFSLTSGSITIGGTSASTINLQNTGITVTGTTHTHTYYKTTEVKFTGTSNQTTTQDETGISINDTNATGTIDKPTITVTDNGHTHTLTAEGSVDLQYNDSTLSGKAKSVATFTDPIYTVTDNGHTHTLTNIKGKSDTDGITYDTEAKSGSTSTGLTIKEASADGEISKQTVDIPAHTHKQQ